MDDPTATCGSSRWRRRLGRLRRSQDGSAAVEFALVSIPFFAMLFAIIETAMVFFVSQMLDTSTAQISRLIRTGQAHQSAMTAAQIEDQICAGMLTIAGCQDRLFLDVRSYNSFGAAVMTNPIDEDGNFVGLQYNIGASSQIVVVRAYYTWPVFFKFLTPTSALPDGSRLLASVAAFRNEPFPW
jgi:Flp pilus assembly protein TadG